MNAKKQYKATLWFLALLLTFIGGTFVSCSNDANEWPIDKSYDRLYTTTNFSVEKSMATSVIVKFNGVKDATKYVFEFSLDSLAFNEIVRTEEVKADTLTPYSSGKTVVQTEYLKLFEYFYGTTG